MKNNMKKSQVPMDTSIYLPERTVFAMNNDAIQQLGSVFDWTYGANGFSEEEMMLATMQAIKNPTWWSNMMMPG
jgi:hypothetical protein